MLDAQIDETIANTDLDLKDFQAWQQWLDANQDGYGAGIMNYAARWMKIMQVKMEDGASLFDIADKSSHEADNEGITGFMYGAAVQILTKCWKHGDDLGK